MPRVKNFDELPNWLQERLKSDWENMHVLGSERPAVPSIRDAEYRVYLITQGLWVVDAGTGGITVETASGSKAYVDLPDDSEIKALVDAECKRIREARSVERLYDLVMGLTRLDRTALDMDPKRSAVETIRYLARILHENLNV